MHKYFIYSLIGAVILFFLSPLPLEAATRSSHPRSFFQVGKCYLFIPRIDIVAKGEVLMVTPQEVVFKNIVYIWPTNVTPEGTGNTPDAKELSRLPNKIETIKSYIASHDRDKLERHGGVGMPWSYSRSAMSGLELDRCGK